MIRRKRIKYNEQKSAQKSLISGGFSLLFSQIFLKAHTIINKTLLEIIKLGVYIKFSKLKRRENVSVQYSFKRYEKKFLLTPEQYDKVLPSLTERLKADKYGLHTICNIYYDTGNFDLIRNSVERPAYKEKFRLRSYGVPSDDSVIFAEIKKKFDGVVYKRRVDGIPSEILDFVSEGSPLERDKQIQREIQWFLQVNEPVPKVFIGYDRIAFSGREDRDLRVTFDRNIRWRTDRLDLRMGDDGESVLSEDRIVMEIKTPAAIPLWLVEKLSENEIYPASFSKYGACYQKHILPNTFQKGSFSYVK